MSEEDKLTTLNQYYPPIHGEKIISVVTNKFWLSLGFLAESPWFAAKIGLNKGFLYCMDIPKNWLSV